MRILVQRVKRAHVEVAGEVTGAIEHGLLVYIGIAGTDTCLDADYLVGKLTELRIFADESGKMNRNIREAGGGLLLVSQFTLYADCRRGRRPSFDRAAGSAQAAVLYDYFVKTARASAVPVATGVFQAAMEVHSINNGPVTFILDSTEK